MLNSSSKRGACSLLLLSVALGTASLAADLDRPYDPIVVTGNDLSALVGAPVDQIRVYVYREATDTWQAIPFQVDQLDDGHSYFRGSYNDILDPADEIVFMARDLGDPAPEDVWVSDASARANPRYSFTVTDTVGTEQQAWGYVYLSPDLGLNGTSYIQYNSAEDRVVGESYTIDHGSKGFQAVLAMNVSAGGDGIDFLDRQKFRLKATGTYGPISYSLELTEDEEFVKRRRIDYKVGDVRLIRSQVLEISGEIAGFSFEDSLKMTTTYYPHYSYMDTGNRPLPDIEEADIKMLRISFDLSDKAYGMIFQNPYNNPDASHPAQRINAVLASEIDATLLWPGLNWYLIVADPGYSGSHLTAASIISMAEFAGSAIGERCRIFFRDRSDPEDPNTGVDGSYGETGIIAEDNNTLSGALDLTYRSFYLPQNLTYTQAEDLVNEEAGLLDVQGGEESYDIKPPARITDLAVVFTHDNFVSFVFTAPGDDGMAGGKAAYYDMRYSTFPVGSDTSAWWAAANEAVNEPTPKNPGSSQNIVVQNLEKETAYHFMMVTVDDMGNTSPFSNVASATTLPVELASFDATATNGQVILEWATSSETNNYGFEIQRRAEPGDTWEILGFIRGAGTASEPNSYRFVDKEVAPQVYLYRLRQIDTDGKFEYSQSLEVVVKAPRTFALSQNHPNPFNPTTDISYRVAKVESSAQVRVILKVYNMLGQEVATLVDQYQEPGWYDVRWNGTDDLGKEMSAGIYICRLLASDFSSSIKMLKMQ